MLTITDYDDSYATVKKPSIKLPKDVENISIGYDRGRLSIQVNGKTLYENACIGSDINIELNRE